MLSGISNTRSLAFLMNVAGEDSEADDDENDLIAAPSPQQRSPSTPEEKQAEKKHRHPSGQCGPLLLNHTAAAAAGHRCRHSSLLPLADLDQLMPGLLTCRDDNMSKLATHSDDDSGDQALGHGHGSPAGDKNEQPSTGRTVAVSEFSNLAGTGAAATVVFPPRKPAAGGDGRAGRSSLGLVPSYSSVEYAGWSKFCLASSDTENEGGSSDSFEQAKEDESEDDSRTYSITSGEEDDGHVNSDETDPPLRGEQDFFDGGGDGGGGPSSGKSFDSDIHFTVQETQAILRVMERLGCGATTLARFASFTLEDWMDEVCDPIIQDLRGSQSYRASGLDARHRFGREESVPPLKRYISAELYPASTALLRDALPARVRRRAFVNTAAAMRGEAEDPFCSVLGNNERLAVEGVGGGFGKGIGDDTRNNFASVVARRLAEHGRAHNNAATGTSRTDVAATSALVGGDRGGPGRSRRGPAAATGGRGAAADVAVRGASHAVSIYRDSSDSESDGGVMEVTAPPGASAIADTASAAVAADATAAAAAAGRGERSEPRRSLALRVDLDAVRAARKVPKHAIWTGGGEGNTPSGFEESSSSSDHSSSSGGCRSGEEDDDEDYYAGDSDSCSPRSSSPPSMFRPLSRPTGGAPDVAGFARLREHHTRQRPSTTVALALNTDTKGQRHPAKSFKAAAGRGSAVGGSVVGYGWQGASPRRGAPGSARPAVEAAAAVVAAEAKKIAEPERATTASRGRVRVTATRRIPAPRPAARLARKHGVMAGLSPPPPSQAGSMPTPAAKSETSEAVSASAAAAPKATVAAAAVAAAAAAAAAAVTTVAMPREFSPGDVCGSGTKAAEPSAAAAAGEKRYADACCGTEAGFTTAAVAESATESKPEYTPESDEATATSSGEGSREQDLQAGTLRSGDLDRRHACYKHGAAVLGKDGVGPGPQRKGRGDERRSGEQQATRSKRVFFASSSSGDSSASTSDKGTGSLYHQGDGGGGGGEFDRHSTRPAVVPAPAPAEPMNVPAAGAERGRLLYEQVIRMGGAAQPKMSPLRPLPKRRPRVVYESLW
ncbi:unnamed protein product [Ectocarpus sp. CCAP 1310/34]|nr:unnamed protein product [Ectocarpus sp. CCAP 1310/34]